MTKSVLVHIKGMQFEQGIAQEESEQIENICPGEYFFKNQAHYILYEELEEGFSVPIKNMIKFKNNELSVHKKGPLQVQMIFQEGKKTLTDYNTPFGIILIGIDTTKLVVEEEEDKISIHVEYALEANYQFVADCEISIVVEAHGNIC